MNPLGTEDGLYGLSRSLRSFSSPTFLGASMYLGPTFQLYQNMMLVCICFGLYWVCIVQVQCDCHKNSRPSNLALPMFWKGGSRYSLPSRSNTVMMVSVSSPCWPGHGIIASTCVRVMSSKASYRETWYSYDSIFCKSVELLSEKLVAFQDQGPVCS